MEEGAQSGLQWVKQALELESEGKLQEALEAYRAASYALPRHSEKIKQRMSEITKALLDEERRRVL